MDGVTKRPWHDPLTGHNVGYASRTKNMVNEFEASNGARGANIGRLLRDILQRLNRWKLKHYT